MFCYHNPDMIEQKIKEIYSIENYLTNIQHITKKRINNICDKKK